MKESKSKNGIDRRDFITKSLVCGAFVGMKCPGMLAMNIQGGVSNPFKKRDFKMSVRMGNIFSVQMRT